jgi:threonine synthase
MLKLQDLGAIDSDETTVLITTGHGLKDPNVVTESIRIMDPVDGDMKTLQSILGE